MCYRLCFETRKQITIFIRVLCFFSPLSRDLVVCLCYVVSCVYCRVTISYLILTRFILHHFMISFRFHSSLYSYGEIPEIVIVICKKKRKKKQKKSENEKKRNKRREYYHIDCEYNLRKVVKKNNIKIE